ncbi:M23 family metallopeptidase [bacterium]|nr:MAG: M23 family metallopeptidase [bacterium]
MRRLTGLAMLGLLLFTTACSAAVVTSPPPAMSPPGPTSTSTLLPTTAATQTPTVEPSPTATLTPTPFSPEGCSRDFCVVAGDFWLQRPISASAQQTVDGSYLYGSSQNGQRIVHSGVEFYNAFGTPVLAAADGRVVYAGNDEDTAFAPWTHFYGNLVILEHATPHNGTLYSLYAHLSEIDVVQGGTVQAGQVIGKVGMSGSAIGSHLHFEVRTDPLNYSTTRNPLLYLAPLNNANGTALAVLAGQLIDATGQFISTPQLVIEQLDLPESTAPQRFYIETYAAKIASDPDWQENFVLSDLQPGRYRVSFVYHGRLLEHFITLTAGQLTYLSLQVEN